MLTREWQLTGSVVRRAYQIHPDPPASTRSEILCGYYMMFGSKILQENHQRDAVGFLSETWGHKLPMCNASAASQQEGKEGLSHKYDIITEQIFIKQPLIQLIPQKKSPRCWELRQKPLFGSWFSRTADFNTCTHIYYIEAKWKFIRDNFRCTIVIEISSLHHVL